MSISLIIITKNEEHNIAACLKSVEGVADEVILVDGQSTDNTVKIAESLGAKVFTRVFDSFTLQKGFALAQATKDWVLNLDADEKLSEELKKEILETVKDTDCNGFLLPSKNIFLGRKMNHSGLKGNYKLRLVRRSANARYEGGKVHEVLTADGKTGKLKNVIDHTPYTSIYQYFDKFNKYTSLGAQTKYDQGKKFNPIQILRPPFDFFKIYIIRLGILDGFQGFLWAFFSSLYPFVKYVKLWEIRKNGK
ncbi:glycosyltransferase involved in cell wall biosynthesis [Elusimicrobium simillimum]|uniref:glycosyltransferase family 2 protein n=1 Tax=Elusimicrobium simillimum TaxID=3143438 RepID=UPI003C6F76D9